MLNKNTKAYRNSIKYRMKWSNENDRYFNFRLNKKSCADIIAFLEEKDNVQGFLKELIRKEMKAAGFIGTARQRIDAAGRQKKKKKGLNSPSLFSS